MNTHDIFDMHKEKKASFPNPINVSITPDANQKLKHQLEGGSNWMDERSEVNIWTVGAVSVIGLWRQSLLTVLSGGEGLWVLTWKQIEEHVKNIFTAALMSFLRWKTISKQTRIVTLQTNDSVIYSKGILQAVAVSALGYKTCYIICW